MRDEQKPDSFREFDEKLSKLRGDEEVERHAAGKSGGSHSGLGTGMQVGIEMVGGIIGGVLIGLGLDYWLDTRPLMLAIFVILGAAAGMLNANRYLRRLQSADEPGDQP